MFALSGSCSIGLRCPTALGKVAMRNRNPTMNGLFEQHKQYVYFSHSASLAFEMREKDLEGESFEAALWQLTRTWRT